MTGTVPVRAARRASVRARASTWSGVPSVNQSASGQAASFAIAAAPVKSWCSRSRTACPAASLSGST
ncbi:hypothetical protein CFP65_0437 [Kitasatospora sp. MMS16-BH015]|nr:hypothetical protein CFP65_0437 [Kitasatospora sp. MMS16-BH015]